MPPICPLARTQSLLALALQQSQSVTASWVLPADSALTTRSAAAAAVREPKEVPDPAMSAAQAAVAAGDRAAQTSPGRERLAKATTVARASLVRAAEAVAAEVPRLSALLALPTVAPVAPVPLPRSRARVLPVQAAVAAVQAMAQAAQAAQAAAALVAFRVEAREQAEQQTPAPVAVDLARMGKPRRHPAQAVPALSSF